MTSSSAPAMGADSSQMEPNFEGPALRPLDRVKIALGPEGDLLVDKSVVVRMRPAIPPTQQHPERILHTA